MGGEASGVVREIRESDATVVVVAAGEITLEASPAFHKVLVEICERRPQRLLIDMSQVRHIDSAGVGTLVEIYRRMTKAQAGMFLVGMQPLVRSMFEITKLDRFFRIVETEQEALES